MKTFLAMILLGIFGISCNTSPSVHETEGDVHATEQRTEQTSSPSLALNNGEKWKADESTNNNVTALEKIVNDFKPVDQKTPEEYKVLHTILQAGIEKMVKECRMKGADHDALHLWLEPLMQMVNELKSVSTSTDGAVSFGKINYQINLYRQYFS